MCAVAFLQSPIVTRLGCTACQQGARLCDGAWSRMVGQLPASSECVGCSLRLEGGRGQRGSTNCLALLASPFASRACAGAWFAINFDCLPLVWLALARKKASRLCSVEAWGNQAGPITRACGIRRCGCRFRSCLLGPQTKAPTLQNRSQSWRASVPCRRYHPSQQVPSR